MRAAAMASALAAIAALSVAWGMPAKGTGEYAVDGQLAVEAVANGNLGQAVSGAQMGPTSVLLRAPIRALIGSGNERLEYALGAWLCVFVALLLIAFAISHCGSKPFANRHLLAAAGIAALNPLSISALSIGHPEELLTGALCVTGVATAAAGGTWFKAFGVLLLAFATKQWALIAIGPFIAASAYRRRDLLSLTGLGALVVAGLTLFSPDGLNRQLQMVHSSDFLMPYNAWWLIVPSSGQGLDASGTGEVVNWIGHPLAVLLPLAVSCVWMLIRRGKRASLDQAIWLLAGAVVVRGLFDPWNGLYYEAPLFVSLAVIGATSNDWRRPLVALALFTVYFHGVRWLGGPDFASAAFVATSLLVLGMSIYCAGLLRASNIRPWGEHPRVKFLRPAPIRLK